MFIHKKSGKEALDELQTMKVDNETYIYEFLKSMEQVKNVIKETWNLADLALQENDYNLHCQCLNDIANHTILLNKIQDFLPVICSMKLFGSELVPQVNYENSQQKNVV